MIAVNGERIEWREGMTVRDVLKARRFSFPLLIVRIDGALVARGDYDTTTVPDDSEVDVLHLMSGG